MKRLTLIMLVAMVPFLTIAQKRSKKDKSKRTEKLNNSGSSYDFMVITGYQLMPPVPEDMIDQLEGPNGAELQAKLNMSSDMDTRVRVIFDFAGVQKTDDVQDLSMQQYKSMAEVVNSASKSGWEFINAAVLSEDKLKIHYYYMRRNR